MMKYLRRLPKKNKVYPDGIYLVHNFPPGDAKRPLGAGGFRAWITDKLQPCQKPCLCGWANGREHYSTYASK
jgi:hypothetical protein